jgi:hypothetical protein
VTGQMIFEWLKNEQVDMAMIKKQTKAWYPDYAERAMNFYDAFFQAAKA